MLDPILSTVQHSCGRGQQSTAPVLIHTGSVFAASHAAPPQWYDNVSNVSHDRTFALTEREGGSAPLGGITFWGLRVNQSPSSGFTVGLPQAYRTAASLRVASPKRLHVRDAYSPMRRSIIQISHGITAYQPCGCIRVASLCVGTDPHASGERVGCFCQHRRAQTERHRQ